MAVLSRAIGLAERIPEAAIHGPKNRNELALHRFLLGAAEANKTDSLIDYVVALEALLLPERGEGELRFRLALFGASYLGSSPEERKVFYRDFRKVYEIRSRIIHGTKPHVHQEVQEGARLARRLASGMLLKALQEGWPTQEQLLDMVLD